MNYPPADPNQTTAEQLLATAKHHHEQGELQQATTLYEQLLTADPRNPELLHLSGLACLEQGDYTTAAKRISLATLRAPDHPVLITNLGLALLKQQRFAAAIERFQDAIRLQPDHGEAYFHWAHALLLQNKVEEAADRLREAIRQAPEYGPAYQLLATTLSTSAGLEFVVDYCQKMARHYGCEVPEPAQRVPQHTFFLRQTQALEQARQNNRVQETQACSGQQLCYYLGDPLPDAPANLVAIPMESSRFVAFFLSTRLSMPREIAFEATNSTERLIAHYIVIHLYNAWYKRLEASTQLAEQCQHNPPEFVPGQPWRVWVAASRTTTVLQYNARDLLEGFRQQGCEVKLLMEADDRELLDQYHAAQDRLAFKPHIILNLDHLYNDKLPANQFNVTWWQDPMPEIMAGNPLPWRQRDLIYSIDALLDRHLYQTGAPHVYRQSFCYDANLFQDRAGERRERVVIVASSYRHRMLARPEATAVLARLEAMFAAGEPLTDGELARLAARYNYPQDDIFWHLWHYVIRDQSVRWLCSLADRIEVEVYGRYWEEDPLVRPFFKGALPHGAAVAAVYNEARYALVSHPFDLQSQRLMEAAACGAIPIVYDCRYRAEPPHWDDHCLWYRTWAELAACLTQRPTVAPVTLCRGRSYADFAQKILREVERRLAAESGR
ncbi:MAG: tetratricopeptide repeat protein [Magnetococcales bacterium]|nr:tetratricopeptide repeat protein [Magnetococcales bacterium]